MSIATGTTRPADAADAAGVAAANEERKPLIAVRHPDWRWLTCGVVAAVLLGVASFMPLWEMKLEAPQYPAGLYLTAYGSRMEGDLSEINELNHYIGIKAIEPESVTELTLFPFVMSALIAAVVAGALLARDWRLRVPLVLAVFAIPVAMLIDMQWWLYSYGHDINPEAPLRIKEFTPKVIGTTEVMNFHSNAMVANGFWLMAAAGILLTIGPFIMRFLWESWNNTGDESAK